MTRQFSDDELKKKLTAEQFRVLREKGTEAPFSGKLLFNHDTGDYRCAACGSLLFKSDDKYDSTVPGLTGWPSFCEAASNQALKLREDDSFGMHRTEVTCANCDSHLGHLFEDRSSPNGLHYCINSAALDFKKINLK
jgi:peptide-methionine (R)-S-oxide reductase